MNARKEKVTSRISSLSEKPLGQGQRRLADWINPTGEKSLKSEDLPIPLRPMSPILSP